MPARAAPLLVVVSGMPGSGKTTLARRLAADLGLALLSKDDVKEPLMLVLGAPDREASRRVGAAAYAVLFALAERALDGGVGAVLESNFAGGQSEAALARLAARSRAVLVHCAPPPDLARARYAARAGSRDPGHHDEVVLREWDAAASAVAPRISVPTLTVDTRDGYRPPLTEIVAFCRSVRGV